VQTNNIWLVMICIGLARYAQACSLMRFICTAGACTCMCGQTIASSAARCGHEEGPSRQARCGAQVYKDMVERSLRGGSRSGKGGSSVGGRSAGAPDDTAHGPDHAKAALGQSGAAHAGAPAKPAAV